MPGFHAQRWALANLMKENETARKARDHIFLPIDSLCSETVWIYVLRKEEGAWRTRSRPGALYNWDAGRSRTRVRLLMVDFRFLIISKCRRIGLYNDSVILFETRLLITPRNDAWRYSPQASDNDDDSHARWIISITLGTRSTWCTGMVKAMELTEGNRLHPCT